MSDTHDKQLADEFTKQILVHYDWEIPIPPSLNEEIDIMLNLIGYGCWFADWLNHKLYTWIMEYGLRNSLTIPEYTYFEDIED